MAEQGTWLQHDDDGYPFLHLPHGIVLSIGGWKNQWDLNLSIPGAPWFLHEELPMSINGLDAAKSRACQMVREFAAQLVAAVDDASA